MSDTSASVVAELERRYRALPGARRVEMACGMFDDAKALAISGILSEHPGLDRSELRKRLFLRIFGEDFAPEKARKILAHLKLA